ncbi:Amino acid transporter AVT3A [Arabidopsis thaliana]|uniref:Amino acid transporter AVT3A n=4 Tax=Arabidopsis TaxID=3701 RepID=AVT3A_ARATH|nr:Transmembrane amino acid transporter family protein [Arabidopsis thaliana]Q9FKY3.1 RecName: Full=Amino acid transporter AVT3A; Short=AtAvt3A; AltName: Full=Aromatic and neutral amino acid transporter-like protein 3 [Arabidopsis thaliana]KAG7607469.1 Amino acid transporter transmembrane domain [Arabidopsis thaliana x Arabidopsis arenosa]KAG7614373.1 Amino acid transporter transmembrane domain [Arabidopsis suecica]ABH04593.1 At5g65990 [Arabidopsis thaliana]AED98135.1 Transmembrane amino acid |eukprot:NP_201400.1 Transmembrane amino acid transporter family protein [Arabidopsis thaliana]
MRYDQEAGSSSHSLPSGSSSHSLPPTEDTPLLGPRTLSSQPKTFANVFIAIVGAGVLGLPYTFKKTGWLLGLLTLLFVSSLTFFCMMLLVHTRRKLESLSGFNSITSFGDLGESVCGPAGRLVVDVMLVLSQSGFCVSYLIFVATTMANLLSRGTEHILGLDAASIYLWGCFPFQLGLNSIPSLTHLAPLSIFADIVDVAATLVVMVQDVFIFLKRRPPLRVFGGVSVFFYGLGVAVYAFEGIGMVLPLELEAKYKDKFGRALGLAMGLISIMYGAFGLLGYMAYGEETKDIITTNLGTGVVSTLVQLGLAINLFFTFPLMMQPVYEVVERRLCSSRYSVWVRWATVLVVTLVALLVPNFADFLSLVGSSVCVVLGFVLPSLFHLQAFKNELSITRIVVDVLVFLIGVMIAITGTWTAVHEILTSKA